MTRADLKAQLRRSPVLNHLYLSGLPLTRENYLDPAYRDRDKYICNGSSNFSVLKLVRLDIVMVLSG